MPDHARPAGRYIEAPEDYTPGPGDLPSVFLAGGITGCPDWQQTAARDLAAHATVLNPRRAAFPIHDPSAAPEQIRWEHRHLHLAALSLFWFPASDASVTTQPIALFELGAALGEGRPIVVGADPDYPRVADVQHQVRLAAPEAKVHDSLMRTLAAARWHLSR